MAGVEGDVVTLLSRWLQFTDASRHDDNLAAMCPFHKQGQERKPSLYVYVGPQTETRHPGTAYCHTCGEGWPLHKLLRKLGASRALVDLVSETLREQARTVRKVDPLLRLTFDDLPVLPEHVLGVFDWCPRSLLAAGFDKDLLQEHDIGFDRQRRRVTFPLRDHHGRLVGVSGRATRDDDYPRYKIYKSELYPIKPGYSLDKSKLLWGLSDFYAACMNGCGADEPVVVCEGFKAALWVRQAGHEQTVALIGAAMSPVQKLLLERVATRVVLFLDNDEPGRKATVRTLRSLRRSSLEVRVAKYATQAPVSPDDLSAAAVLACINAAVPPNKWRT